MKPADMKPQRRPLLGALMLLLVVAVLAADCITIRHGDGCFVADLTRGGDVDVITCCDHHCWHDRL